MQIKEILIRTPRTICIALSLVAATATNKEDGEESDARHYEFEYETTEELEPILKRSRVINEETLEHHEEVKDTDNAQEAPAKKRVEVDGLFMHNDIELTEEEKKLEDAIQEKLQDLTNKNGEKSEFAIWHSLRYSKQAQNKKTYYTDKAKKKQQKT
ncbi:hypothetical protein ENBRE01_3215 [Enteropsectra breve]|nr:hypothetical protein ENBRE01_3215 [Enteropsectra breve]